MPDPNFQLIEDLFTAVSGIRELKTDRSRLTNKVAALNTRIQTLTDDIQTKRQDIRAMRDQIKTAMDDAS